MPDLAALFASAVDHHRAGRLAQAATLYEQILTQRPGQPEILHLLGLVALHQGDATRAESLFSHALDLQPNDAALHLQHGLAFRTIGHHAEALAAFSRATALDPALAEAHHQTGNLLKALGRFEAALTPLREAARLAPQIAPIWLNLGVAALESGARTEALSAFHRAATLEPSRAETHNILGHTLALAGRASDARAAFTEALRLRPGYAAAHDNLGRLAKSEGQLIEAVEHFRAALAAQPSPDTHSNLLLALNYLDLPPETLFAEHQRWNELHARSLFSLGAAAPSPRSAPPRLRLGYLSPDFVHHAVAYFIEPVLATHDRTRVEVFCYSNARTTDRVTTRLRGLAEHWRDISLLDDDDAAALIRNDQLDVLVDLAGHTAHHRLLVLARRPAPLQATWIGYPNTTGLTAIDYRLTDAISDPPGETDAFHSEKLVRLPTTFSCYRPDDDAPLVNALPATAPGAVTFGCFNNFAKVSPAVIALWSQLLRELPSARLMLKSRGLADMDLLDRLRAKFGAHGIAPERLAFNGEELPTREHLALYHGVDIALDPFPYNGTTTTCEALWMGVPVITLAGGVHAARVGASLLTHAGLADWIASSADQYVKLAIAAAHDLPRLAALRRTLRDRLRTSPLCDAVTFTRRLEDTLIDLSRAG